MRRQYQIKRNKKHLLFKCSSADLCGDPEDKSRAKKTTPCSRNLLVSGGDDDDCWLLVITAPPAHISLSSQQMMGHLCLAGATGVAGAFLTRLLITPSGHRKSQSRDRRLDQCCPTGDLLSGWQSDTGPLLSSRRRD